MRNLSFILFLLGALPLHAQIIDPNETVKRKATDRANSRVDQGIDKGLDKVEEGIGSLFKKKDKRKGDTQKDNAESRPGAAGKPATAGRPDNVTGGSDGEPTDFTGYKGSAFIPGKDLLFFEDFSTAKLGPGAGNWFVNNWDPENPAQITTLSVKPGNWLKITKYGHFFPNSFKSLPENCTIELDMYYDVETVSEMQSGLRFSFVAREDRENFDLHFNDKPEIMIDIHPYGSDGFLNLFGARQYGLDENRARFLEKTIKNGWNPGKVNHVAIARNGLGVKIFVNGKEMAGLPDTFLTKADYNFMMSSNQWGNGVYITNIRVGGNAPNAASDMNSSGKFVTDAIHFDVNSSRIKPESWAVLKQAADAIKSASGNILIVGHTDSDGPDEANLILSQKRAASVKLALVKEFGIQESRLATDGKGESEPLEDNATAWGKAKNRRVEFIR